jgi:hypothetical protein
MRSTKAEVIVVFHTSAGHVTLRDQAYSTDRMASTGNPYKEVVAESNETQGRERC